MVWIQKDVERYVPVSATDREFEPNQIHPTPLCLASIEALLRVFESLKLCHAGGNFDAIPSSEGDPVHHSQEPDSAERGLGPSE
ncbi:MAG: hypothetical protein AAGF24_03690 [Cyanobacteria bacterium P01_H01_bin.121]